VRRVLYQIDRFGYLDGRQKHEVTPQDLEGNGTIIEKRRGLSLLAVVSLRAGPSSRDLPLTAAVQ
jgi:hypothetical protein